MTRMVSHQKLSESERIRFFENAKDRKYRTNISGWLTDGSMYSGDGYTYIAIGWDHEYTPEEIASGASMSLGYWEAEFWFDEEGNQVFKDRPISIRSAASPNLFLLLLLGVAAWLIYRYLIK